MFEGSLAAVTLVDADLRKMSEKMGYEQALKAAGAEVYILEHFGSYQGEWLALVEFNGNAGWVEGSYGSCSGCDSFESEFDYRDDEKEDYKDRLAEFGMRYLDTIYKTPEILPKYIKQAEWDLDAEEIVKFLQNPETYPSAHVLMQASAVHHGD